MFVFLTFNICSPRYGGSLSRSGNFFSQEPQQPYAEERTCTDIHNLISDVIGLLSSRYSYNSQYFYNYLTNILPIGKIVKLYSLSIFFTLHHQLVLQDFQRRCIQHIQQSSSSARHKHFNLYNTTIVRYNICRSLFANWKLEQCGHICLFEKWGCFFS